MKAVFTIKPGSRYDDLPEERYHFPKTYLRQVEKAVGDWIVYYEPRRGDAAQSGRQAYHAIARLAAVTRDERRRDHFYAHVTDYLEFERPVPFREGNFYYEQALKKADSTTNKGAFGRSVRGITNAEFDLILRAGFAPDLGSETTSRDTAATGLFEDPADFDRPIIERIVSRPFRETAFRRVICEAYDRRCAITGLRIINGGGRPEVQAAHIRPVSHRGPDSVRNGIALSGTVHWMFDRGLISLDDDCRILTIPKKVPEEIRRLFHPDGRALLPPREDMRPHPKFLEYHRENIFRG